MKTREKRAAEEEEGDVDNPNALIPELSKVLSPRNFVINAIGVGPWVAGVIQLLIPAVVHREQDRLNFTLASLLNVYVATAVVIRALQRSKCAHDICCPGNCPSCLYFQRQSPMQLFIDGEYEKLWEDTKYHTCQSMEGWKESLKWMKERLGKGELSTLLSPRADLLLSSLFLKSGGTSMAEKTEEQEDTGRRTFLFRTGDSGRYNYSVTIGAKKTEMKVGESCGGAAVGAGASGQDKSTGGGSGSGASTASSSSPPSGEQSKTLIGRVKVPAAAAETRPGRRGMQKALKRFEKKGKGLIKRAENDAQRKKEEERSAPKMIDREHWRNAEPSARKAYRKAECATKKAFYRQMLFFPAMWILKGVKDRMDPFNESKLNPEMREILQMMQMEIRCMEEPNEQHYQDAKGGCNSLDELLREKIYHLAGTGEGSAPSGGVDHGEGSRRSREAEEGGPDSPSWPDFFCRVEKYMNQHVLDVEGEVDGSQVQEGFLGHGEGTDVDMKEGESTDV
ncbi:unnamed protein product [Amoebophrya sp. A25]|nr:unnamed protein product [Amoebophrya sp. A25]|eukprot:GSA25T00016303001.1